MKHLINITDLSCEKIETLLQLAQDMKNAPEQYQDACAHKILATLFFEPSTRTRLSFESAMLSLGGRVLGFSAAATTSAAKGETLGDTIEMVNGYADIIAIRHPGEGAAALAASHAVIPLINAGDGGHFHPTQTLTDLFTIQSELGTLSGLCIGLCGDLKYGRTVHSLIAAMIRYPGIRFVLIAPPELRLPRFCEEEMERAGVPYAYCDTIEEAVPSLDVLYMTRVQQERFSAGEQGKRYGAHLVLTPKILSRGKKTLRVLHPLPRVGEIETAVDADPRACYFRQAHNGRYVRMALIASLLLCPKDNTVTPLLGQSDGILCKNPNCITAFEPTLPALSVHTQNGICCAYCDKEKSADS